MRDESNRTLAVPVASVALSAGAAVSFVIGNAIGFLSEAAEAVFTLTALLGWVMLVWASIIGGGYAILLGWRRLSRRPVLLSEAMLGAAALGLIILVVAMHPLGGTGSGFGG